MTQTKLLSVCLLAAVLELSGCRDARVDVVQPLQEAVAQMDARLLALETKPRLDFAVHNENLIIEEKMFTPLLIAQANLQVQGDNMPRTFYVDVMLKVEVDGLDYVAVERQIFPVMEGRGKVEMQHPLPQHGLQKSQLKVTLKPMTWYRGQVINDDMINYQ